MTLNPLRLWRQLFVENGEKLNTARLWFNVYALLGAFLVTGCAVGAILLPDSLPVGLGVGGSFGFIAYMATLMAWRSQRDRKASDLAGALSGGLRSLGQSGVSASIHGRIGSTTRDGGMGKATDDERET